MYDKKFEKLAKTLPANKPLLARSITVTFMLNLSSQGTDINQRDHFFIRQSKIVSQWSSVRGRPSPDGGGNQGSSSGSPGRTAEKGIIC